MIYNINSDGKQISKNTTTNKRSGINPSPVPEDVQIPDHIIL